MISPPNQPSFLPGRPSARPVSSSTASALPAPLPGPIPQNAPRAPGRPSDPVGGVSPYPPLPCTNLPPSTNITASTHHPRIQRRNHRGQIVSVKREPIWKTPHPPSTAPRSQRGCWLDARAPPPSIEALFLIGGWLNPPPPQPEGRGESVLLSLKKSLPQTQKPFLCIPPFVFPHPPFWHFGRQLR